MSVKVTSVEFGNEFANAKTDWLLAVIGETITATIKISVGWFAIATPDDTITFTCAGYPSPNELIQAESNVFLDFKVGDVIDTNSVLNTNSSLTITEKISDTIIRIGGHTFVAETSDTATVIGVTPITALTYFYGLIENSEAINYLSKIDNSSQKYKGVLLDASDLVTVSAMLPQGGKAWQNGSMTIIGDGVDTFYQKFIITHEFKVLPHFLEGYYQDLIDNIKPELFEDINSLKYVAQIQAQYDQSDPNNIQEGFIDNKLGNVGFYGERFNDQPTNYYIESIEHTTPGAIILPSIEASIIENNFKIVIKNTIDTPFVDNFSNIKLSFSLAPEVEVYQNQLQTVNENFAFDSAFLTLGSAPINGDLFGTNEQVFKSLEANFVSSSEIEIVGKIAFTAPLLTVINGLAEQKYLISAIVQDHTLDTPDADKVNLLADINEFYIPLIDDGMIEFETSFIEHNDDTEIGVLEPIVRPGDEVIVRSIIALDSTGRDLDTVDFNKLEVDIISTNGSETFVLDEFDYSFANDLKVGGVTFVNFEQNRVFKLPLNDPRRLISIKRREDLDAAGVYYYEVRYPILFRWEYWVKLNTVNTDFFDTSEPNNGLNHFWHRYNSLGWSIKARIRLSTDNNGVPGQYEDSLDMLSRDYNTNADWINEYIKSYTVPGAELVSAGTRFIQGFAKTRIEAFFEHITPFDPADITVVIWIETKEAGGVPGRMRISSLYDVGAESCFESVDTSNRVKLTFTSTTVIAEALINNSKIPDFPDFAVYARLYYPASGTPLEAKMKEDGTFKLKEDGDYKILD